jgi:hypothetical protein
VYATVLALHNVMRWVVIGVGIWAVIRFWRGWVARAVWTDSDAAAARWWVTALDVQFLLGLLLYFVLSPLTRGAFSNMGAAMRDPSVRYFVADHAGIMLVAIVVAHVAVARVRRSRTDSARFQTAAIWLGISLAAIIGFVPWMRPLFPSF